MARKASYRTHNELTGADGNLIGFRKYKSDFFAIQLPESKKNFREVELQKPQRGNMLIELIKA